MTGQEREALLGLISRALDDDQDGYRLAPDLEKEMRAALAAREEPLLTDDEAVRELDAEKVSAELGEALWHLDRIAEAVLLAHCDEIRGGIWATYNAASAYLKARLAADEAPS